MELKKNQVYHTKIVDINILGFGIAKIEGMVVFVQNGVTGDEAKIKIIKSAKSYAIARIEELIVSSEKRNDVACPHFKRCGGCAFQHISYDYELEIKKRHIEGCLMKERIPSVLVKDVLSTREITGYRNKAQYPVSLDEKGNVIAGFYAPKTHRVCPVDRCAIQDDRFHEIVSFVCRFASENGILPYDEFSTEGLLRHIFLRVAKGTGEVMLCLVLKEDRFPHESLFVSEICKAFPFIKSIVFNINPDQTNVILGKRSRTVWGKDKICDVLCEARLEISPLSFYQVNHDGAELLYRTAFEMARLKEHDYMIDLYCGIGSISLSAGNQHSVLGVEIVPDAVRDATSNAALNGADRAKFICGDAADAFQKIKEIQAENPLLVVDPPRKGLAKELIFDIAKNSIGKVLYISCGPDTLARDLKVFMDLGYSCDFVQPVDLFPRTSHVESIALLSREKADDNIHMSV